jgi:hypothetical protein
MQTALATHNIDSDGINPLGVEYVKKVCFILLIYFSDDE